MSNPMEMPFALPEEKGLELSTMKEVGFLKTTIDDFESTQIELLRKNGLENGVDEFIKTGRMSTPFLDASGFNVDIDSLSVNNKLSVEGIEKISQEMKENIKNVEKGSEEITKDKVNELIVRYKAAMEEIAEQIQNAIKKKNEMKNAEEKPENSAI